MFHTMDCIPIIQFAAPKGASLEPPPSSKPILTNGYEIHPCFITKVQKQSFSREKDDNPYAHLQEFKQVFTFWACHTKPLSESYFCSL